MPLALSPGCVGLRDGRADWAGRRCDQVAGAAIFKLPRKRCRRERGGKGVALYLGRLGDIFPGEWPDGKRHRPRFGLSVQRFQSNGSTGSP